VRRLRLPAHRGFEDLVARLADLDGDGAPEAVVVETDIGRGALFAVDVASDRAARLPARETMGADLRGSAGTPRPVCSWRACGLG
jgi:hypothetical protein